MSTHSSASLNHRLIGEEVAADSPRVVENQPEEDKVAAVDIPVAVVGTRRHRAVDSEDSPAAVQGSPAVESRPVVDRAECLVGQDKLHTGYSHLALVCTDGRASAYSAVLGANHSQP